MQISITHKTIYEVLRVGFPKNFSRKPDKASSLYHKPDPLNNTLLYHYYKYIFLNIQKSCYNILVICTKITPKYFCFTHLFFDDHSIKSHTEGLNRDLGLFREYNFHREPFNQIK